VYHPEICKHSMITVKLNHTTLIDYSFRLISRLELFYQYSKWWYPVLAWVCLSYVGDMKVLGQQLQVIFF